MSTSNHYNRSYWHYARRLSVRPSVRIVLVLHTWNWLSIFNST